MGTTGLIYLAIVAAWLAYLVPHWLRRREDEEPAAEADPSGRFAASEPILTTGTSPALDQGSGAVSEVKVSTSLTRRAALAELGELARRAAAKRRRVLIGLLAVLTVVLLVSVAGVVPGWLVVVPALLLVGFVGVARISVAAMRRDLDLRYEAIVQNEDEDTVAISRRPATRVRSQPVGSAESGAAMPPSGLGAGVLWEPLPITVPTYVSTPLAPRTVRTIDLSAPDVSSSARSSVPVTAEGLAEAVPGNASDAGESGGRLRAVGE